MTLITGLLTAGLTTYLTERREDRNEEAAQVLNAQNFQLSLQSQKTKSRLVIGLGILGAALAAGFIYKKATA